MPLCPRALFPVCCLFVSLVSCSQIDSATASPIVWSGPTTTFSKLGTANPALAANQDRLTDNVWITRGGAGSGGIYNAKTESSYNKTLDNSPLGTEWATSLNNPSNTITASNYAALDFTTWATSFGGPSGSLQTNILTHAAVVHLIADDIYLNVQFTAFNNTGLVTYQRSTPTPVLLGDYNGNGFVDAADYTTWRDALTAGSTTLANDSTPGVVNESDFTYWRDHFGQTLGGGAGSAQAAVPEPATIVLTLLGWSVLGGTAKRGRWRRLTATG
jgi:hypothetical protein